MSTTAHKMEQLQCDRDDLAEQLARHAADRDRRDAARAAADEELQEAKKQAALAECVRHGLEAELKRLRAAMAEQERALHEAVTERLELVHSVEKLESFAGRRLAEVHALKVCPPCPRPRRPSPRSATPPPPLCAYGRGRNGGPTQRLWWLFVRWRAVG